MGSPYQYRSMFCLELESFHKRRETDQCVPERISWWYAELREATTNDRMAPYSSRAHRMLFCMMDLHPGTSLRYAVNHILQLPGHSSGLFGPLPN